MRIGVDIRTLLDRRQTGIAVYVRNLLNELTRVSTAGETYYFFSGGRKRGRRLPVIVPDSSNVRTVHRQWPNRLLNASMTVLGWPYLDRLVRGADCFFLPHLLFAACSRACPLVVTVHDLSFFRLPSLYLFRSRWWHRALRVKRLLLQAEQVIAVSEHTKRDVVELIGVPAERVHVIYSGPPPLPPIAVGRNDGPPTLLVVGNLEWRKNPLVIIEAFEQAQSRIRTPHTLVFLGGPGWVPVPNLKERIEQSPARQHIRLLGEVSQEEKAAHLAAAHALLFPSLYEGFGFPVLEAFAARVPVIASTASAVPEVAGSAGILVDPENVNALTEAIIAIANDDALSERMTVAGERALTQYSWEQTARATLNVLRLAVT